ncbi:hypothetical protein BO71DRAFT_401684, partial [Aspergillus ellipticus CBS 707.79]
MAACWRRRHAASISYIYLIPGLHSRYQASACVLSAWACARTTASSSGELSDCRARSSPDYWIAITATLRSTSQRYGDGTHNLGDGVWPGGPRSRSVCSVS